MTQIAAAKIEKKTYTYTDAAGQAAFEVWYFNDNGRKEVYQRRPSGEPDGSWLLGLDAGEYMRAAPDRKIWAPFNAAKFEKYSATGQRKVFNTAAPVIPYQLRELRDAVAAGRMIYLAANEEEAEFIRGFGFVATCCAGGAENWRRPELNVLLRGADVVLYNGAKLIAQSLAPIVRRLRIVDFEGDTVEELTTRTAAAKDYKPDYVVSDPESPAAAPAANVTPLITPNSREVRESITTLAAQAKAATKHLRDPGLLQIILIHPLTENVGTIYRYALDDPDLIERMTSEAVAASKNGHNVYIEGRTVRRGLASKQRGGLADTVAVFALVVDSDADKGKAWTPTVPTSLAVETSPGNKHFWLFLEAALEPAPAQKLGARLRAATKTDGDTGNVCQPYRIAGTVNYPGKKKLERGRVITPTHSLGFDPETLWTPERIEQEFQPSSKPTNDGEDPDRSKVPEGVESSGQYEKLGEGPYDPHAEPELIAAALAVIPHNDNDKHSDNYWNEIEKTPGRKYMIQVGMAVKAASNNSAEGFTLFNNWRSGAPDYNADNVRKKWEGFHPTKIGFGTLSFYADKAAPGWREEYEARKASTQSTQQQAGAGLPELIVNDSDPTATAKDLATLIAKQDDFLFNGYVPVHVVAEADCMPRALEVTTEMVRILAHEICVPVQEKKVKKGKTVGVANVPVPLSNDIARLYLHGLEGRWELKPFNGITTAPILSNNGTIRTASGYDLRSGLWCYNIPDITVPTRPTKDDAEQALRLLRWFFRTFPFADAIRGLDRDLAVEVVDLTKPAGLDESSFLAALMTSVSRQSLELAPGFLCDAPNYSGAGTGKGLLVKAACVIASGAKPPAFTSGHDADEFEKRLTSALIEARPATFLDHFNNKNLTSNTLASALTENPAMVRVFGQTKNVPLNTRTFIGITGNAVQIAEDMARRLLNTHIDARMENPEQRKFAPGFLDHVLAQRPNLLAAALTIWRWGRQNNLSPGKPLGSYEVWTQWCRDPLIALGMRDPVDRIAEIKAADPKRQNLIAIFNQWWTSNEDDVLKASELADEVIKLIDEKAFVKGDDGPLQYSRQRVTNFLTKHANTRVGGYLLEKIRASTKNEVATYKLTRTT